MRHLLLWGLLLAAVNDTQAQTCETSSITPQYVAYGSHWKGPIHFVLNPSGMPAAVTIEQAQAAIDAWVRYAEIEITLMVDLTVTGGDTPDGVNVISFGNPGNGYAATFNSINGNEITESDIVFYDNEALNRVGQFTPMLCHELGHVLGLGHSLDSVAMMYAVAHGPERGATLAPDDRAAIQFVYAPKTSTGPGVTKVKLKGMRLIVSGETDEAVTLWVNGETYKAKPKGTSVMAKGPFVLVDRGFNVLVMCTPTATSDPIFF